MIPTVIIHLYNGLVYDVTSNTPIEVRILDEDKCADEEIICRIFDANEVARDQDEFDTYFKQTEEVMDAQEKEAAMDAGTGGEANGDPGVHVP